MSVQNFSGVLRISNIDDFVGPSQSCVVGLNGNQKIEETQEGLQLHKNPKKAGFQQTKTSENKSVKVTLSDCLACSGCVTSSETILLQQQSLNEILEKIKDSNYQVIGTVSPQSVSSLAVKYNLSLQQAYRRLAYVLKSYGVDMVFDVREARKLSLHASYQEFRESYFAKTQINQATANSFGRKAQHMHIKDGLIEVVNQSQDREESKLPSTDLNLNSSKQSYTENGLKISQGNESYNVKIPYQNMVEKNQEPKDQLNFKKSEIKIKQLPLMASACPGWILYSEKSHSELLLPHISTLRSPQAMAGGIIKKIASKAQVDSRKLQKDQQQQNIQQIWQNLLSQNTKQDLKNGVYGDEQLVIQNQQTNDLYNQNGNTCTRQETDSLQNFNNQNIFHFTIMPCYDKKLEASRQDYKDEKGIPEVDCVITTEEIQDFFVDQKINLASQSESDLDTFTQALLPKNFRIYNQQYFQNDGNINREQQSLNLWQRQGKGCKESWQGKNEASTTNQINQFQDIDKNSNNLGSGGYADYIFRQFAQDIFGVNLFDIDQLPFKSRRNSSYRELSLIINGKEVLKFALMYGFKNIQSLVRQVKSNTCKYDYVEVMACPSGCLNGGGQIKNEPPKINQNPPNESQNNYTQSPKISNGLLQQNDKSEGNVQLSNGQHNVLNGHVSSNQKEMPNIQHEQQENKYQQQTIQNLEDVYHKDKLNLEAPIISQSLLDNLEIQKLDINLSANYRKNDQSVASMTKDW